MDYNFNQKVVCITGANGGIGREIAKKYADCGAILILCFRNKSEKSDVLMSQLIQSGNKVYPIYFDMEDEDSIKNGIKQIRDLKLKINILINNAGIPHLAILAFTRMSDVRKVFQINYFAQLQLTQGLLSTIKKNDGACIVNISSIAGLDAEPGNIVYGATKASMALFTQILSKELSSSGIRVNAVAPGLTETSFAEKMGQKAAESMMQKSAMHRLATAEEIADAVLFLSSERASFINGQILRVDGSY